MRLTAVPFAIAALLAPNPAEAAALSKAVTWLPGTTVDFSSFAEVMTGYDSNPDNLEIRAGSTLEKAEAGITARANSGGGAYALSLLTRQYEFQNLDISHRWDFRIRADADFDISATQRLKAGGSYLRDFLPLNRADIFKGYLDYTVAEHDYLVRMQAKSSTELNLGSDIPGGLSQDIFDVTKGPAYDYTKNEGQIALLLMPKSWWQPFATYNYSYTDYFHQVVDPIISRTAPEHFAIAGVRFKPTQEFRIDLGARVNHRRFDDLDVPSLTTWAFDGNFVWRPAPGVEVTGVAERQLKETTSSFGLVDDIRTLGLTADWHVDEYLKIDASAYYDHLVPVGDKFVYDKYTATLGAAYEASDHLELFVSGLAKLVQEQTDNREYTRYKIGAGARVKF